MNERIRELAKQAGHRYVPSSNSGPLRVEYLTPEMEKFAELIVRECSNIACEYDAPKMSGPGMIIAGRIETHFGIEDV